MDSIIGTNTDIYKSLFDYSHNACYAIDLEGNFILINDAAVAVAGYQKEEILNMPFISILQEDCIDRAMHYFYCALQGDRQTFDISMKHKNGSTRDLYITAVPIWTNGQINGIAG